MRKWRSALCALALLLLIPPLIHARRVLPLDNRPLVAEKYAGWSGVLRLWVFEGWPSGSGSLSAWLNRCVSRFEKRHPGVYIQPQSVDAGAIADFRESGILPPDLLLMPPGLLDSPEGLVPLAVPDGMRPALRDLGAWGRGNYALAVAAGGYAWAWNPALTDRLPDTWRGVDAQPAVPTPERWRRWDAALLALCSGRRAEADASKARTNVALPGVDLGLTPEETPAPTAAPEAGTEPCRLPEGFAFDGDAWRRFVNGEAAAMPVTQREVRRLAALNDQGKGPDWRLSPGGAAFTDQLLFLAVVEKADADAQRSLCLEFADWLLDDACQSALCEAGAFCVTDAPASWSPGDPLAQMDAILRAPELAAPRCFDVSWPETAESIVRDFIVDAAESPALWRSLCRHLSENPNIIPQARATGPEIAAAKPPI